MRRSILPVILAAGLLTACGQTSQGDALRAGLVDRGARGYDALLENAEFAICYAASVGSVQRRYGRDQQSADAYNALCSPGRAEIIKPLPTQ